MRSELVFGAMKYVSNRYLLTRIAAKATRKLHRPYTRIEDTFNDVLVRFNQADRSQTRNWSKDLLSKNCVKQPSR